MSLKKKYKQLPSSLLSSIESCAVLIINLDQKRVLSNERNRANQIGYSDLGLMIINCVCIATIRQRRHAQVEAELNGERMVPLRGHSKNEIPEFLALHVIPMKELKSESTAVVPGVLSGDE